MSGIYKTYKVERFENADGWHTRVLSIVNGIPVQVIRSDNSDWLTVGIGDNVVHLPPEQAAQWIKEYTDG